MLYGSSFDRNFLYVQDFAMRSLEIAEDSHTKADVVDRYQVKKGRKWDERYKPTYLLYVFENLATYVLSYCKLGNLSRKKVLRDRYSACNTFFIG